MYWLIFSEIARAQAAAAAAPAKQNMLEALFPMAMIFFVFYFIAIRPKQKQMKQHQEFISALKRGDEVLTTGGIFGEVAGLTDQFITLQVADNVKIKVLRNQIIKLAKEGPKA